MGSKKGLISLDGASEEAIEALIYELSVTGDELREASKRALQSTARTIALYVSKDLAKELSLPLEIVKSRIQTFSARRKSGDYYRQAIVLYAFPFPAVFSKMSPDNENAFKAKGGKRGLSERIWSRQGRKRHPLFQEVIPALDSFEREAAGLHSFVFAMYRKRLLSEIKYVAGKKRYR